jgi:hypothetical protein
VEPTLKEKLTRLETAIIEAASALTTQRFNTLLDLFLDLRESIETELGEPNLDWYDIPSGLTKPLYPEAKND